MADSAATRRRWSRLSDAADNEKDPFAPGSKSMQVIREQQAESRKVKDGGVSMGGPSSNPSSPYYHGYFERPYSVVDAQNEDYRKVQQGKSDQSIKNLTSNPNYGNLPTYKHGGIVNKTGPAILHKGERVVPKDGHWMEKAFSKHKGSFRAIAKRHGRSTKEEAEADKGKGGKLGKKANLALIGMRMANH